MAVVVVLGVHVQGVVVDIEGKAEVHTVISGADHLIHIFIPQDHTVGLADLGDDPGAGDGVEGDLPQLKIGVPVGEIDLHPVEGPGIRRGRRRDDDVLPLRGQQGDLRRREHRQLLRRLCRCGFPGGLSAGAERQAQGQEHQDTKQAFHGILSVSDGRFLLIIFQRARPVNYGRCCASPADPQAQTGASAPGPCGCGRRIR